MVNPFLGIHDRLNQHKSTHLFLNSEVHDGGLAGNLRGIVWIGQFSGDVETELWVVLDLFISQLHQEPPTCTYAEIHSTTHTRGSYTLCFQAEAPSSWQTLKEPEHSS